MENKIKAVNDVLIVSDTADINGGAAKVAITSAIGLAEKGVNVIFFAGGDKIHPSLLRENIKVVTLNMPDLLSGNKFKMFFNGVFNRKAKKEFDKLLSEIDLDNTIVHVHSWVKILSASIFLPLKKRKKEFFITTHDYFTICPNGGLLNYNTNQVCCPIKKGFKCLKTNCDSRNYIFKVWRYIKFRKQEKILKGCKYKLITISKFLEDVFAKKDMGGVFVKNPITLNTGDLIPNNGQKDFYYIGRLSKEKGVSTLVSAFIKNGKKVVIVGGGPEEEKLKETAKDYDNLYFTGWINGEKIPELYPNIKCLVFPSTWYEGAPLTIPEVQSYGVPCIVSDACAGKDYIVDGENGYIFKAGNVDDLIEKINLIENLSDSEYSLMREKTYKIAKEENYDVDKHVEKLISVYQTK